MLKICEPSDNPENISPELPVDIGIHTPMINIFLDV